MRRLLWVGSVGAASMLVFFIGLPWVKGPASMEVLCPVPDHLSPHFVEVKDAPLLEELKDCRRYWSHRSADERKAGEPADFPLAYSVVVHKDLAQLEKLVR